MQQEVHYAELCDWVITRLDTHNGYNTWTEYRIPRATCRYTDNMWRFERDGRILGWYAAENIRSVVRDHEGLPR